MGLPISHCYVDSPSFEEVVCYQIQRKPFHRGVRRPSETGRLPHMLCKIFTAFPVSVVHRKKRVYQCAGQPRCVTPVGDSTAGSKRLPRGKRTQCMGLPLRANCWESSGRRNSPQVHRQPGSPEDSRVQVLATAAPDGPDA